MDPARAPEQSERRRALDREASELHAASALERTFFRQAALCSGAQPGEQEPVGAGIPGRGGHGVADGDHELLERDAVEQTDGDADGMAFDGASEALAAPGVELTGGMESPCA